MEIVNKTKCRYTFPFLLICFCTYLLWVFVIPYNSAPDEYMRFDLVKYMCDNSALPSGWEASIREPAWGFSYAFLPFLPQMISALFGKLYLLLGFDAAYLYLAARLPSVLFSTASAWFLLQIGNRLFQANFKWFFAAGVAFWPQFIFLSSYINNEALAFLAVVAIVYYWLFGAESGWALRYCVGLGVALSVCALTYYNAYGFILFSVPYFIVTFFWQNGRESADKRAVFFNFLKKSAIIVAICLVLAGWWFLRSYLLYGDITGLSAMMESSELYAEAAQKPSNRVHPQSLWVMLFDMGWLLGSVKSFIGMFDYTSIALSTWLYRLYVGFVGVGVAGNAFGLAGRKRSKEGAAGQAGTTPLAQSAQASSLPLWPFLAALVLAAGTSVVLSMYNAYTSDFQAQGRYFIYVLIPLSYFAAKGFERAVLFVNKPAVTKVVAPALCAVHLLLAYYIFLEYIVVAYL